MTEFVDVFVTADDIAAANEASSFLLTIPPDAAKKGDPTAPGGTATWKQQLKVLSTKAEACEVTAKDKEGNVTGTFPGIQVEVEFEIPGDARRILANDTSVADPNAGRSLRQWYRLVPEVVGNKSHVKYKSHYFNLGRLKGIIASAGWTIPDAGFSIKQYFGGDLLVNATVNTIMSRTWFNGKAKDEVSDFITPKVANA